MATNTVPRERKRKSTLSAAEQEAARDSVLSQVKGGTISAVVGVGNLLDTPGSMLRDVLALENPFDQLLSPMSDANRTSGRDLLTKYGITQKNKPTGVFGTGPGEFLQDAAGFAADVLLDPPSWLTKGVTASGKLAKKAGVANKVGQVASRKGIKTALGEGSRAARAGVTLRELVEGYAKEAPNMMDDLVAANKGKPLTDDILDMPVGGTIGVTHPFSREAKAVFNNDAVNDVLDSLGTVVRNSAPVRALKQMIGGRRRGSGTELGQDIAEQISDSTKAADAAGQMESFGIERGLMERGFHQRFTDELERELYKFRYQEGILPVPEQFKPVFDHLKSRFDDVLGRSQQIGLNVDPLRDDYAKNFAARVGLRKGDDLHSAFPKTAAARFTDVKDPHGIRRAGLYKDVPDGTAGIIVSSRTYAQQAKNFAGDPKGAVKWFEREYGPKIPGGFKRFKQMVSDATTNVYRQVKDIGGDVSKADFGKLSDELEKRYLGRMPDWYAEEVAKRVHGIATTPLPDGVSFKQAVKSALTEDEFVRMASQRITANVGQGMSPKDAILDALGNTKMEKIATLFKERYKLLEQRLAKSAQDAVANQKTQKDKPVKPKMPSQKTIAAAAMSYVKKRVPMTDAVRNGLAGRLMKVLKETNDVKQAYMPDEDMLSSLQKALPDVIKAAGTDPATFAQNASGGLQKALGAYLPDMWNRSTKSGQIVKSNNRRGLLAVQWFPRAVAGELDRGVFADFQTAVYRRMKYAEEKASIGETILNALADKNIMARSVKHAPGDMLPAQEVLKKLGFKMDSTSQHSVLAALAEKMGTGPRVRFPGKSFADLDDEQKLAWMASLGKIDSVGISRPIAEDLLRINKRFTGPEPMSAIAEKFKDATQMIKSLLTAPWIAFHGRNRLMGMFHNILRGMWSKKDTINARYLYKGKVLTGVGTRYPAVTRILAKRRGFSTPRGPNREAVNKQAMDVFGTSAAETMAIADARAIQWAEETGLPADDFYKGIEITQADAEEFMKSLDSKVDTLFQGKLSIPLFESKLFSVAHNKVGGTVTPDQFRKTLVNAGVTQEEMRDMGVDDLLEKLKDKRGKVDGNRLLEELNSRIPEIEENELLLSHASLTEEQLQDVVDRQVELANELEDIDERLYEINAMQVLDDALIEERRGIENRIGELYDQLNELDRIRDRPLEYRPQYSDYQVEDWNTKGSVTQRSWDAVEANQNNNYRELLLRLPSRPDGQNYNPPHFRRSVNTNAVAHARFDDYVTPNGKRYLRIQELQSDWHQSAQGSRRKPGLGYLKPGESKFETKEVWTTSRTLRKSAVRPQDEAPVWARLSGEYSSLEEAQKSLEHGEAAMYSAINRAREANQSVGHSGLSNFESHWFKIDGPFKKEIVKPQVPDAPFKESWHRLLLRRILRIAADEGYDGVVVVKGSEIAKAVGGPPMELNTFYNEKVRNELSSLAKKLGGKLGTLRAPVGTKAIEEIDAYDAIESAIRKMHLSSKEVPTKRTVSWGDTIPGAKTSSDVFDAISSDIEELSRGVRDLSNPELALKDAPENSILKAVPPEAWLDARSLLSDTMYAVDREYERIPRGGVMKDGVVADGDLIARDLVTYGKYVDEILVEKAAKRAGDLISIMNGGIHKFVKTAPSLAKAVDSIAKRYNIAANSEQIGRMLAEVNGIGLRTKLDFTPDMVAALKSKPQPLYQAGQRGAVQFFEDGRKVITAFKNADRSTFVHETAHIFRRTLSDDMMRAAEDAIGVKNGVWDRAAEEAFADGFEKYLEKGIAPTPALQTVFSRFKNWMIQIYSSLVGRNLDIHPKLKKVFDEMLGGGKKFTPEQETDVLRELIHSYGMGGPGKGQWLADKETGTIDNMDDALNKLPGMKPGTPYKDFVKGWTGQLPDSSVWPWKENFGPYKGGASLGEHFEGMNRTEAFLNLLAKDVDPAEAARIVTEAHVDYSNSAYTKFESQIAQQIWPFWKFLSRNTASTAKEILNHPGGPTAMMARGLAYGHDPDELTPEHIANTAAIPLGVKSDGTKRYLTGLGSMEESAFNFINPNMRSMTRMAMSNMNPLLKWIPEWASGESYFQAGPDGSGRDFVDMDPLLGRIGANVTGAEHPYRLGQGLEYVAGNSPASRALHTIRQMTDPRKEWYVKAINTATGFRVSDVSPDAQTAVLRDAVQTLMRESGGKSFSGMYFPEGMELTPEQEQFKVILDELNIKSRARREERRKKEGKDK